LVSYIDFLSGAHGSIGFPRMRVRSLGYSEGKGAVFFSLSSLTAAASVSGSLSRLVSLDLNRMRELDTNSVKYWGMR
jgi:hypothetical protein